MKLGIITDVHNNLTALNAVMARFDEFYERKEKYD